MYANQSKSAVIGLAAGTSMEPPTVPQASEIAREHAELRQSVDVLARVVSDLNERLQPIIMQVPVGEKLSNMAPDAQCHSAIGQDIYAMRSAVQSQTARLIDLLNALAV